MKKFKITKKFLKTTAIILSIAFFAITCALTSSSMFLQKKVMESYNSTIATVSNKAVLKDTTGSLKKELNDSGIKYTSLGNDIYIANYETTEDYSNAVFDTYADSSEIIANQDYVFRIAGNAQKVLYSPETMDVLPEGMSVRDYANSTGKKIVAVIDTGVNDYAIDSYDFTNSSTEDVNGHGTMVAAQIIESSDNNALIVSLKAMDDHGNGYVSTIIQALNKAMELQVDIINMSISAPDLGGTEIFKEVVQKVIDSGITIVAAAGNNSGSSINYIPSNIEGVISVGAMYQGENGEYYRRTSSNFNVDYYAEAGTTSVASAIIAGKLANNNDLSEEITEETITTIKGSPADVAKDEEKLPIMQLLGEETFTYSDQSVEQIVSYGITISNSVLSEIYSIKNGTSFISVSQEVDQYIPDYIAKIYDAKTSFYHYVFDNEETAFNSLAVIDSIDSIPMPYITYIPALFSTATTVASGEVGVLTQHASGSTTQGWGDGKSYNGTSHLKTYQIRINATGGNGSVSWSVDDIFYYDGSYTVAGARAFDKSYPLTVKVGSSVKYNQNVKVQSYFAKWTPLASDSFSAVGSTTVTATLDTSSNDSFSDAQAKDEKYCDSQCMWYWFNASSISASVTVDAGGYTLTVNPNGGKYNGTTGNSTFKGYNGMTKDLGSASHDAYTVKFDGRNGSTPSPLTSTPSANGWKVTSGSGSVSGNTYTFGAGNGTVSAQYKNNSITLPSSSRTGYTFAGWYTAASGGSSAGSSGAAYTVGSSTTLYAHWNANTYTINYNGNGNTGGSTASSSHTYDQKKALNANGFTRTGYTFAGWTTNADGSGDSYSNGQQVENLATGGTVTLYAKWTANTYTISYNGNDHTGGSTASSSHTYDTAKALTANGFTRTGYSFAGWNTNANGSGTSYADKASVKNLSSTNGATVTLYAQWTPHTYKVNFDSNGGYDVRNNKSRKISSTVATYESNYETQQGRFSQETWTYDDKTSANNSIKNKVQSGSFFWPGHTFLGWATKADATSAEFSTTKNIDNAAYPGSNGGSTTLYAVWQANSITTKIYPTGVNGDGTWNAVSWVASDNSWSNNGNYNNGYTAGRGGVQTINGYWGDLIKLGPATPNDRTATISYNANTSDSVSGMRTSNTVEWVFNRWTKDSGNLGILEKNNANSRTKAQIQAGGQIESQGSFSYYVVQSSNNDSVSANYYFTTVQLPILSRNGYTFLGWYYDADCTQKAGNGGQRYRAFKTETLYARWQKNTYEYADNGSVFMQDDDSTDKNVYLRKVDADTFEPLKSVTVGGETYGFEICVYQNNASGPLVARLNTAEGLYNGSGTKIQGTNGADSLGYYNITSLLTQGRTYLVRETSAAPGYTYDEDQTFTYTGNERISITVEDSPIGISADVIEEEIAFKIDPYGRKVANATFELKDITNGKVMGNFTTNERGTFPVTYDEYGNVIDGLLKYVSPRHTYTLTETVAPEGYSTAPVITFTVPRDGRVNQIKITEAVKTTTLQIKKTNSDDVGLANAKFQLFMKDKDGNLIKCYMDSTTKAWVADETVANATPMIATTGDDGIATFSNIPIRASFTGIEPDYTKSYYLKEIEAPQGYNLLPEIFEIRIPDNGATSYLYTVKDESIVLTLEAGGSGVTPTVFTGGLLMMFAIALAYFRKLKQD